MRTSVFFSKNWPTALLVFCLFQSGLFGQIAIEAEKVNVMYVGVYNPITVVVNNVPDSCIALRSDIIKCNKLGNGRYDCSLTVDTTAVTLSILDTCNNEVLGQRAYRVRHLNIEILLGGRRRSGTIEVDEFRAQFGIIAQISSFDVCGNCTLVGFDADFFSKNTGVLWEGHNTGARFEGAVLEKQQTVMPGDRFVFRQFSYQCPGMKKPRISDDKLFFEIK